jgi:hypothetical protein
MNRHHRFVAVVVRVWSLALFVAGMTAHAQFKVVGPAPVSPTVARQQIRTLLEKVEPSNRQQTIQTLTGLLAWYRDILDEELIAAWKKDPRANLMDLVESLADSRVASDVVEFSWREQPQAALNLSAAPMLGQLMVRFPESAKPFLDDLLGSGGQKTPNLSEMEAKAVCRILLDMPDIGMWRRSALQILPHYRRAAENLLVQDLHGGDQEKSYQAQRWLSDLKLDVPTVANEQPSPRRRPMPTTLSPPSQSQSPMPERAAASPQTAPVPAPRAEVERPPVPAATSSATSRTPLPPDPVPSLPPYAGAKSGTLESSGGPIAQNAEYVFRNLPAVKMQLDYDAKTWDARLVPGEGQTQRLILRNKSSGPQKRCVVRWSVIP